MPNNSRLLLFCHKQLPQEYDDRRTVEPKESEVKEGNLNGEKTIEVGRKLENEKWCQIFVLMDVTGEIQHQR